jgi:hypothetical protein
MLKNKAIKKRGYGQKTGEMAPKKSIKFLVKEAADALIAAEERITVLAIWRFLANQEPRITRVQISRVLAEYRGEGLVAKHAGGRRVKVGKVVYESIRKAAAAQLPPIHPEKMRKWIISQDPQYSSYRFVDDIYDRWQNRSRGSRRAVRVGKAYYLSVLDAARGEKIAPDTVRKRIKSTNLRLTHWRYAD